MEKPTHKLGELLMQAGLIDEIQLRSALGHQKRWGGKLGKALVDQGFIDEEVMLKFLAERFKMKAVNLIRSRIAPQTFEMVPENVAKKFEVIPVVVTGTGNKKTIVLAMSDPSDLRAIDEVQFLSGAKVEPVLATDSAISKVLQHYGSFTPEMAREYQYEKTAKPLELKQTIAAKQEPRPAASRAAAPRPPAADEGVDLEPDENIEVVKGEVLMLKAMKPSAKQKPAEATRKTAPPPAKTPSAPPAPGRAQTSDPDSLFLIRPDHAREMLQKEPKPAAPPSPPMEAPPLVLEERHEEAPPLLLETEVSVLDTGKPSPKEPKPETPSIQESPPAMSEFMAPPDLAHPTATAPSAPDLEPPSFDAPPLETPPLQKEQATPAFFIAPSSEGNVIGETPDASDSLAPPEIETPFPSRERTEDGEIAPIDLPEEEPGEMQLASAHEFIQPPSFEPAAEEPEMEKLELADAHEFISPGAYHEAARSPKENRQEIGPEHGPPPLEEPPLPYLKLEAPTLSDDFLSPASSGPEPTPPREEVPPDVFKDLSPASARQDLPSLDLPPLFESEPAVSAPEEAPTWDKPQPLGQIDDSPIIKIKPASPDPDEAGIWGKGLSQPAPSPLADDVWEGGGEMPADDIWGAQSPPPPASVEPEVPDLPPPPEHEPTQESTAPGRSPAVPTFESLGRPEEKLEDYFEAAEPESEQELEFGIDRSDHVPAPPGVDKSGKPLVFLPFEAPPPGVEGEAAAAGEPERIRPPEISPPLPPEPAGVADDDSEAFLKIFQPDAMSNSDAGLAPASKPADHGVETMDAAEVQELGSLPELDLQPLPEPPPPSAPPPPDSAAQTQRRASAPESAPEAQPLKAPLPEEVEEISITEPAPAGELKQVWVAPDESPESLQCEEDIKRLMDLGDEFLDTKEVKKRLSQLTNLEIEVQEREYQFDELLNLMMRKELGEITQELFMKELQVLKKKAETAKKKPGKK
jgi:type IV pilus assembly protein PilB